MNVVQDGDSLEETALRQSPTVERSDSGQRFPQSLSHGFAEVMERNELARRASFRSSNIYVIFVKSKSLELRDEFQTVFVVKYLSPNANEKHLVAHSGSSCRSIGTRNNFH